MKYLLRPLRLLRFMLLTGHFRQDAGTWILIALLVYNAFNPFPSFIYDGEGSLGKALMGQTYIVLVWLAVLSTWAFGVGRILGGFKFSAESVQHSLMEQGYPNAHDMSWWTFLGYRSFWTEVLLYIISGLIFFFIAYWGGSQEWNARPWLGIK